MNTYVKQIISLSIAAIFCAAILMNSFSQFENSQNDLELQVEQIAEGINNKALKLSSDRMADLLVVTARRDLEKGIVGFYVSIAIASLTLSLFIFSIGFYSGNKHAKKRVK